MAAKWSSEYVVAEHKDLQANAMALDALGQYVVLAGRRCLAVIDLNNPSSVVKKVQRQSKWEVGSAEWNPHLQNSNLCAISSNQRTDILTWRTGELGLTHTLRSHTRAVSDLHWHRFDPNLLATCSVDTFINIWDIRDPRKPSISLSAVVGATQVRWNRINGFLLATAHEGDVRVWDPRKSSSPVQYIAAHLQKIHGLDWSPFQDSQLATSSQDCTVKFFDVNNPRSTDNILRTTCPVWRARYTPFGEGMVTVVVPQLRRGENSLLLWSLSDLNDPVHTFIGHTDVVLEFEWKKPIAGVDDYQLVTWSKDQCLRIWKVDSTLQRVCGFEPENEQPTVYGENGSSGIITISPSNAKDVETGLEVSEETILTSGPSHLTGSSRRASSVRSVSPLPPARSSLSQSMSQKNLKEAFLTESDSHTAEKHSLDEEIYELKSLNVDSVDVKDPESGEPVLVTIRCSSASKASAVVMVTLPRGYPFGSAASFQFVKGAMIDASVKAKILKGLSQIAQQSSKKGIPVLGAAVKHIQSILEQFNPLEKSESEPKPPALPSSSGPSTPFRLPSGGHGHTSFLQSNLFNSLPHSQDHYVPYPRSSGARFCGVGILVCFGRPSYLRRVNNKTSEPPTTPRSLSVAQSFPSSIGLPHTLSGGAGSVGPAYGLLYPPVAQSPTVDPDVSISSFYSQDRRQKYRTTPKPKSRLSSTGSGTEADKRNVGESRQQKVGAVTIYDASRLMPQHVELAEKYVFSDTDVQWMCSQNAAVAAQVGRKDLVHLWTVAGLLASPALYANSGSQLGKEVETPWAQHPFGRKLLQSMIDHYVKQFDIQTVAMLCCAFGNKTDSQEIAKKRARNESSSPGESPYHTIHPGDILLDKWNLPLKQNRSNSWSDSLDEFRPPSSVTSVATFARNLSVTFNGDIQPDDVKDRDTRLLDPKMSILYDNYRRAYADILYRWGLTETRVQVLKYLSTPPESQKGVEMVNECSPCRQTVRGPQCPSCKRFCFTCIICRVAVKGPASFCLSCGHGGHSQHMASWFEEQDECATGCGCHCLEETAAITAM